MNATDEHSLAMCPLFPHRWHTSLYLASILSFAVNCFCPQNFATCPPMPHLVHIRGCGQFRAMCPGIPHRWHAPSYDSATFLDMIVRSVVESRDSD